MMLRLTAPLVAVVLLAGPQAQVVRAEPISTTVGVFLFKWALGQGVSMLWDAATGKPNVREMKRQLDALAASDRAHAAEIGRLRDALDEKMDRKQVEELIMKSLARVDQQLADLAQRVQKLEDENKKFHEQLGQIKGRASAQDARLTDHAAELRGHTRQLTAHETRILAAEQKLRDHEKRIGELERKFAHLGAAGFEQLWKSEPARAVEKFDDALAEDPAEPGFYYGKAIALIQLGKKDDAKRVITTGTRAELQRAPGKWYQAAMENVQGRDRIWFEDTRVAAMPVESPSKR